MRGMLTQVADRINALSARERLLLFLSAIAALVGLWNLLFLMPLERTEAQYQQRSKTLQREITTLHNEIVSLGRRIEDVQQSTQQEKLQALQRKVQELDERMKAHSGAFVGAAETAKVLRDLLAEHKGLTLLRLENLGAQRLKAPDSEQELPIFRHGLVLEFTGDYMSTLRYLQALEALSWQFFWDNLEYRLEDYPKARVLLRIHTLSGQEKWIGV